MSKSFSTLEEIVKENVGISASSMVLKEISKIASKIPDNPTSLSPAYARELSGTFLKGMDLCSELYAISVAYELKMETLKKKEHGEALIVRAKGHGFKTAKEKESYANTDLQYIDASDKHAEAKMFRILIEMRRKDFEKAHYLMRKISEEDVDKDYESNSWNESDESISDKFNTHHNKKQEVQNARRSW